MYICAGRRRLVCMYGITRFLHVVTRVFMRFESGSNPNLDPAPQIVRVLANLAAQGDCNTSNNVAIARTPFCLSALVALTKDGPPMLQIEAATALWNLAFDEGVRELIAAEGGVHSLVGLAKQCCGGEVFALQERVTGALWGLSASQGNSVLIGEEGGIPPLIHMARSASEVRLGGAAPLAAHLKHSFRRLR